MANWQKEIMTLANDFCLHMAKAKEIVLSTDKIIVPEGKDEEKYKYERAYSQIKPLIMNVWHKGGVCHDGKGEKRYCSFIYFRISKGKGRKKWKRRLKKYYQL